MHMVLHRSPEILIPYADIIAKEYVDMDQVENLRGMVWCAIFLTQKSVSGLRDSENIQLKGATTRNVICYTLRSVIILPEMVVALILNAPISICKVQTECNEVGIVALGAWIPTQQNLLGLFRAKEELIV